MRCPRLRGACPDLNRRFEPRGVVDRPCLHECQSRHRLDGAEYRRSAGRAEPPLRCAVVALAGSLERGEGVALHRECLPRYAYDHRERRSGLALAVRAVANPLPDWLGVHAVGHATAQAATRDGSRYIGHAPATLLRFHRAVPEAGRRSLPWTTGQSGFDSRWLLRSRVLRGFAGPAFLVAEACRRLPSGSRYARKAGKRAPGLDLRAVALLDASTRFTMRGSARCPSLRWRAPG